VKLRRSVLALLTLLILPLPMPKAEARDIVDMTGRSVTIPDKVGKIYSASYPLTLLFYAFAPDLLAAVNLPIGEEERRFFPTILADLPAIGGAPGHGRSVNPEEVVALHPDFILAWVDPFGDTGATERQWAKSGLPIVYVRLNKLADYPAALRFLGDLLGRQSRGEELAAYIELVLARVNKVVRAVPPEQKLSVFYAESPDGLATECDNSFHLEAIVLAGGQNIHHCVQGAHMGMEKISLEEIILARPSLILALNQHFKDKLADMPQWRNVEAVAKNRVYVAPHLPINWLDRPPTFMRVLGVQWLANLFYPELYPLDVRAETKKVYRLFLGDDLSDADVDRILH